MKLQWVALYTIPTHRVEFKVLHEINQHEFQAMLPYEVVYEKKPGTKLLKEKRYAMYPRYVFAGLVDLAEDYSRLRTAIPEIAGIVSKRRMEWSPYVLKDAQMDAVRRAMDQCAGATEVDIHKALKPGKAIEVDIGGVYQATKIEEVTRKGVKAVVEMLGGLHIVDVPFSKIRAA